MNANMTAFPQSSLSIGLILVFDMIPDTNIGREINIVLFEICYTSTVKIKWYKIDLIATHRPFIH